MDNSQEVDLDKTDRLPILDEAAFDDDVEDDARIDTSTTMGMAAPFGVAGQDAHPDIQRAAGVDLPSLAESVRSVEERIARQHAEYEALKAHYEDVRGAESIAVARANALAEEMASIQVSLQAEQARTHEFDRTLSEQKAAALAARAEAKESLQEAEKYQSESRAVRISLEGRDAKIAEVLHSLGERDAQLNALQREHAQIVPALEARSKNGLQLEADLAAARDQNDALAREIRTAQAAAATLGTQLNRAETELVRTRQELSILKSQAAGYLEHLGTREWRRGFDQNLFREMDAKIGAAQLGQNELELQRNQLRRQVGELQNRLAAQDETIGKLQSAVSADTGAQERHASELNQRETIRATMAVQLAELEAERDRLQLELKSERVSSHNEAVARDSAASEARAAGAAELELVKETLSAAEASHANLVARVDTLRQHAETREEEMAVLMTHLQEARRPAQAIESEIKRLSDELSNKSANLEQLNEDNRSLRSALERTRGALEEREFLIRRLERSESNNANVLGRIQTSIERLGGGPPAGAIAAASGECAGELIRLDGDHATSHSLGRRTRIGRAPGCELQIDYSSVSRHHALVLMGPRDVVIEDLNSTNGVIVNGRKISRQLLNDGDVIMIGEVQFRLAFRLTPRALEAPADGAV